MTPADLLQIIALGVALAALLGVAAAAIAALLVLRRVARAARDIDLGGPRL